MAITDKRPMMANTANVSSIERPDWAYCAQRGALRPHQVDPRVALRLPKDDKEGVMRPYCAQWGALRPRQVDPRVALRLPKDDKERGEQPASSHPVILSEREGTMDSSVANAPSE